MKRKRSFVLDEKDERAVELFTDLGMPRNLAKTLMFISQVDECKSAEVEQGADLRQPEVSVAMQEMRRRGWAEKRDLKKKGKGRPVHIYTLTKRLPEILNTFELEKMKQVETIKKDLTDLQGMIKEYK
ncbi:MAG: ArsR family transcriptional regulator [Thermoplasmatales archaeon]|jgi:predicted transcriptional regulator|nr:ArsR family transcriptional regulator [Thermoplasmatales archaeon]